MSMMYYKRRHKDDKGGSNKVTTLADLSPAEKVEKVEKADKPKTTNKK